MAKTVVELSSKGKNKFKYLYEDKLPLFKKIEKIAKEFYKASEVIADSKIRSQLKEYEGFRF